MQTLRRGGEMGQVQVGDTVAPAQPFMKIVDIASMQVQATVSQVESEELRMASPPTSALTPFPS